MDLHRQWQRETAAHERNCAAVKQLVGRLSDAAQMESILGLDGVPVRLREKERKKARA